MVTFDPILQKLVWKIIEGDRPTKEELLWLVEDSVNTQDLIFFAGKIRETIKGNKVQLCAIVNAKSGKCSENCRFCSQSAYHKTNITNFPLQNKEVLIEISRNAAEISASHFGIVTSGKNINEPSDFLEIIQTIKQIKAENKVLPCASLGTLDIETARELKDAGLTRYHHNLETAPSFFPQICTTHSFANRIETLKVAEKAGMETCSGGIFGLGETWEDRIDLALLLRELKVKSVPLNFLVPIKGTPMENQPVLEPMEILKIIALYRFALPDQDIKVCGGRSTNLRDLQSWIFMAGANGMMIGNYLTTPGREVEVDLKMLEDLNLTPS